MSRGEYDEVISISKYCQCLYFIDSHWWLFCNIWCCICPSISSFIIKLTLTEQNDIGHVTHPRLRYNLYDKLYLILLFVKNWSLADEYALLWFWNGSGEENSEPRFWKCFYWNGHNILLWFSVGLKKFAFGWIFVSRSKFLYSSLWLLQCLVLQAARGKEMQWRGMHKEGDSWIDNIEHMVTRETLCEYWVQKTAMTVSHGEKDAVDWFL